MAIHDIRKKAFIDTKKGGILFIPKTGFAPLLFLEHIALFDEPVIEKIVNDNSDYLQIKLIAALIDNEQFTNELLNYINLNL